MVNERMVQVRVLTSPGRFRHAVDEHLAIIAALKARDARESMETMRRHLESARQSLVLLS
jgi:DNA-binding GntR family transcriptional regulator